MSDFKKNKDLEQKNYSGVVLFDFKVGTKNSKKYLKGEKFLTKDKNTFEYLKSINKIK